MIKSDIFMILSIATIFECSQLFSMNLNIPTLQKSNLVNIPNQQNLHFNLKKKIYIAVKIAHNLQHLNILKKKLNDFLKEFKDNLEAVNWLDHVLKIVEQLKNEPNTLELQKFNNINLAVENFDAYIEQL